MRYSNVETIRSDRSAFEGNIIGTVISTNKVQGTVNARTFGDISRILTDLPLVGGESILGVEVGDKVAISNFSGTWVVLGVIQIPTRRTTHKFPSLDLYRDLETDGVTTSYGDTYVHGVIAWQSGTHYLYLDGDDIYWWDGSTATQLN